MWEGGGLKKYHSLITQRLQLDTTLKYNYKIFFFPLLLYPVEFGKKILCSLGVGKKLTSSIGIGKKYQSSSILFISFFSLRLGLTGPTIRGHAQGGRYARSLDSLPL